MCVYKYKYTHICSSCCCSVAKLYPTLCNIYIQYIYISIYKQYIYISINGLHWWLSGKESTFNVGDMGLIPGSERSPGEGNGNLHSFLAWEIPWTEETGELLPSVSQRVGHDWVTKPPLLHIYTLYLYTGREGFLTYWLPIHKVEETWVWTSPRHYYCSVSILKVSFHRTGSSHKYPEANINTHLCGQMELEQLSKCFCSEPAQKTYPCFAQVTIHMVSFPLNFILQEILEC